VAKNDGPTNQVPRYALSGQTVQLTCNFSLPNNRPFYSLKVRASIFLAPSRKWTENKVCAAEDI
jgi:hypothetical protein